MPKLLFFFAHTRYRRCWRSCSLSSLKPARSLSDNNKDNNNNNHNNNKRSLSDNRGAGKEACGYCGCYCCCCRRCCCCCCCCCCMDTNVLEQKYQAAAKIT
ncbi:unnamed protein product [Polarella glacialis]|uniref:Uncharacterized protein n=1 Tax=Polarella glacialis TaxID=89957 RepID=A0A813I1Q8_POLGL|nr:unnamed protein product [Polarella glacialis]